jgi:hypothetical protein
MVENFTETQDRPSQTGGAHKVGPAELPEFFPPHEVRVRSIKECEKGELRRTDRES